MSESYLGQEIFVLFCQCESNLPKLQTDVWEYLQKHKALAFKKQTLNLAMIFLNYYFVRNVKFAWKTSKIKTLKK